VPKKDAVKEYLDNGRIRQQTWRNEKPVEGSLFDALVERNTEEEWTPRQRQIRDSIRPDDLFAIQNELDAFVPEGHKWILANHRLLVTILEMRYIKGYSVDGIHKVLGFGYNRHTVGKFLARMSEIEDVLAFAIAKRLSDERKYAHLPPAKPDHDSDMEPEYDPDNDG
jgi:hypothetical protein